MAHFEFRYFFDGVTGHCLWSANDAAREKFGYPVFLDDLAISDGALRLGNDVLERYGQFSDADFRWESEDARLAFERDARDLLRMLREQLGPDSEIRDEAVFAS